VVDQTVQLVTKYGNMGAVCLTSYSWLSIECAAVLSSGCCTVVRLRVQSSKSMHSLLS